MKKQTQPNKSPLIKANLSRSLRKKTTVLAISFLIFTTLAASMYLVFVTQNSEIEKKFRSLISVAFRTMASLDADEFESPVSVEQTFLFDGEVLAYTDKLVYGEGESLKIHYSFPNEATATISHADVGTFGQSITFPLKKSSYKRPLSVSSTLGFKPSDTGILSIDLEKFQTGWHQIQITSGKWNKSIPFFIQPDSISKKIVFVESTNTFKAYVSDEGLRNQYSNPGSLLGKFTRPESYPAHYVIRNYLENPSKPNVNCDDHLINADLVIKSRLIEYGLDFDVVSEDWLSSNKGLDVAELIILGSHHEYWTSRKFANLKNFIDNGGKLLILGGNTAWRFQEKIDDSYTLTWGNGALESKHAPFIRNYLGSVFDSRDYKTSGNFVTSNKLPDFLANLKIENSFGRGTDFAACKKIVLGASGLETDKIIDNESKFKTIASGNNPLGGADIVFAEFPGGGSVLNFGSVGLWHGLGDASIREIVQAFSRK